MTLVRMLSAEDVAAHAADLGAVLRDCVAGGASVSFMPDLTEAEAETFFRAAADDVARGGRVLFAAFQGDRLVGTVQLLLATPPNQPHRAEIAKLLVHRAARKAGIGLVLVRAAEHEAARRGKTLINLDTCAGTPAERLYHGLGYQRAGVIPHYALFPDGRPCDTVIFWKTIGLDPSPA